MLSIFLIIPNYGLIFVHILNLDVLDLLDRLLDHYDGFPYDFIRYRLFESKHGNDERGGCCPVIVLVLNPYHQSRIH
jgi:hypothetical protein